MKKNLKETALPIEKNILKKMNKIILKDIQEDLVNLFQRLNGYFTTGLIIHSPTIPNNKAELDTLGITRTAVE